MNNISGNAIKFSSEWVIDICREREGSFKSLIGDVIHDIKGIMNSEMLFFCAMSDYFIVDSIIESGRARGISTEIIARYHRQKKPSIPFYSVELQKYTDDSLYAMHRLRSKYSNLHLLYGNALDLVPALCSRHNTSVAIIDGPKGKYALQLASLLLINPGVKAVFIHDAHKDTEVRRAIEEIFPLNFSSDDDGFVREFQSMDAPCWEVYQHWEGYRNWGPYRRGDKEMSSYGPTLSMLVNTTEGIDRTDEVREFFNLPSMKQKSRLAKSTAIRSIIQFPPRKWNEIPLFFKYYSSLIKPKQ